MAEKNNAVCSICGKPYHLCLSCKDAIKLSPWKIHTDTSEHYKIFQVIKGYSANVYTKDEAKNRLKNIDLSDIDSFRQNIKLIIEDILKEPVVDVKTTVSRKKNYKKVEVDKNIDNVIADNINEVE